MTAVDEGLSEGQELADEQGHYDRSREAREEHRRRLGLAPGAAASPKDAASFKSGMEQALDRLPGAEEPAFFGRIDLDDTDDRPARTLYLGAMSVLDEAKNPLVINFNAPAAACYYKASPADPMGLLRKRTFEVQAHRLTDFEEVVLTELEKDLEALEKALQGPEDSLLRDLESSRDGNMRHIARTIGAAQYDVISHPLDRMLVVQGGPGTGKTAVALHRVSYWLYNSQSSEDPTDRLSPTDVLVVGPNQAFTKYISRVLPGLGDGDIEYAHLRSLGPQASGARRESMALAKLKGERRMALLLERALRNRIRIPDEPLQVGPTGNRITIAPTAIKARVSELAGLPYRAGREQFRTWLGGEVTRQGRTYPAEMVNASVERVWPLPTSQRFLQELLASQNMLLAAAGDDFSAGEIHSLQRQAAARIGDETWSDADVALIDEVEWLMDGRAATYKHIVVDEAQDLSHMQLRSLRRRSANGSMTVVGDLAQSTGPHARDTWDDVVATLAQGNPSEVVELEYGYRVPRQVYEFAAQLLPFAAPAVTEPRVIRSGPADPELLVHDRDDLGSGAVTAASAHASRGAFVGIVCPRAQREPLELALQRRSIRWADGDAGLNANLSSINVVSPETAKGLEFDAVVVVDPEEIVSSDPHGLRLLYIALTRTTAHLSVVHSGRAMPIPEPTALFESRAEVAQPLPFEVGGSETKMVGLPQSGVDLTQGHAPAEATMQALTVADEAEQHPDADATRPTAPAFDLSAAVVAVAVEAVVAEVRRAVPEGQFARLIDALRKELGVSDEQLFEMIE